MKEDVKEYEIEEVKEPVKPKQSKGKVQIMFNQNRTFELYVGREYLVFAPFGMHEVSEEFIQHPDFQQQSKYFSIRQLS